MPKLGARFKIGILLTLVDATHFPVDANDSETRFELLSMSRIQPYTQNKNSRKTEKIDFSPPHYQDA